jgi:hypothetical protein
MKINMTFTATYDFNNPDLQDEFNAWNGDYDITAQALEEFIKDRFIDPHFDIDGGTLKLVYEF